MTRVLFRLSLAIAWLFVAADKSAADSMLFGGIGFGSPQNRGALITVDPATGVWHCGRTRRRSKRRTDRSHLRSDRSALGQHAQ